MSGISVKICILGALAAGVAISAPVHAMSDMPRLKPPAPGPSYLSRLDQARLKTIHTSLEKKSFAIALAELQFIDDPAAKSLGRWLYYMAKDPRVDIAGAAAFLDAHPDWPAMSRIQRHVESQFRDTTDVADILTFFKGREPLSGNGKLHLARALLSNGRGEEATDYIADAWISHNFPIATEKRVQSIYNARLSKDAHAARVDRLLWARQVTNARRVFQRLSKADRRNAEARAALLLGAATGPKLYQALPREAQLDSGVLYSAVRYYRRSGNESQAIQLAAKAPVGNEALRNADRWWTERRLLTQWALRDGRPSDAYAVASKHGMTERSGDFSDAEFLSGWIALRFLNEPERAKIHFEAMTGMVSTPISLSRGHYWIARAAEAANDAEEARKHYKIAARHHYSFYGQLAAEVIGETEGRLFHPAPEPDATDRARFNSRPAVAAMRMLSDLDLDYEFMIFAYHIDGKLDRPGEYIELARLANGEGAPHLTVRAGKVAVQNNAFTPEVSYPLIFIPDEARAFVKPEIILALSRQESEFNPRAYSRAGARGVMQLMPTTAQITARIEGMPYRRSALLDDPVYNMTIGSAHLSHLIDRFDGSLIMTFAGYNAGPHRVSQWVEYYGDPRTGEVDPLDWIELIPFSETRNYVMRVLENIQVYRARMAGAEIPGQLHADIERGGASGRIATGRAPSTRLAALTMSRSAGGEIPALPAQTALFAVDFREALELAENPPAPPAEQTASPDAPDAVTPPSTNAADDAPRRGLARFFNRTAATEAPIAPDTRSAPAASTLSDKTVNIVAVARAAEPVVNTQEATAKPSPTIAVPSAPADNSPISMPEDQSAVTPAEPFSVASVSLAPEAVEPPSRHADFADKIVKKSAKRLQIEDEGDAIAAAIIRGLELMEADADPEQTIADRRAEECATQETADGDDPTEEGAETTETTRIAANAAVAGNVACLE